MEYIATKINTFPLPQIFPISGAQTIIIFAQKVFLPKESKYNFSPTQRNAAFILHWNIFWLTMTSQIESTRWS